MISSFYAAVLGLWVVWLSLRVVKLRRKKKVPLGHGDDQELKAAVRVHGNAVEYLPLAIILLILIELNGGNMIFIHAAGIALIAGRILHFNALTQNNIRHRVLGMQLTLFTIIAVAALNLFYIVF